MSTEEKSSYRAYLLRGWQEESTEWRFRLQNVQTGEQIGFTDLQSMLVYLRAVMAPDGPERDE